MAVGQHRTLATLVGGKHFHHCSITALKSLCLLKDFKPVNIFLNFKEVSLGELVVDPRGRGCHFHFVKQELAYLHFTLTHCELPTRVELSKTTSFS